MIFVTIDQKVYKVSSRHFHVEELVRFEVHCAYLVWSKLSMIDQAWLWIQTEFERMLAY